MAKSRFKASAITRSWLLSSSTAICFRCLRASGEIHASTRFLPRRDGGRRDCVICSTAGLLEEEIKSRVYKDMQDPDITIQDNAWAVARVCFNHLPSMSVEGLTEFRRDLLRQIHPDRVDMKEWNAVRRESWTVFFNMLDAYTLSLIEQYTERAEVVIKSGGIA